MVEEHSRSVAFPVAILGKVIAFLRFFFSCGWLHILGVGGGAIGMGVSFFFFSMGSSDLTTERISHAIKINNNMGVAY